MISGPRAQTQAMANSASEHCFLFAIEGRVNGAKTFRLVRGAVKIGHPHAAEPDGRDGRPVFAERLSRKRGVSDGHNAKQ